MKRFLFYAVCFVVFTVIGGLFGFLPAGALLIVPVIYFNQRGERARRKVGEEQRRAYLASIGAKGHAQQ